MLQFVRQTPLVALALPAVSIFFGLSIRKLNFLGAFLINAAKCRRAKTLAASLFLANHLAEQEQAKIISCIVLMSLGCGLLRLFAYF